MNNTPTETANLLNHRSKLIGKRAKYYTEKESEVLIKKINNNERKVLTRSTRMSIINNK